MLKEDGHLFHIDFGHYLGKWQQQQQQQQQLLRRMDLMCTFLSSSSIRFKVILKQSLVSKENEHHLSLRERWLMSCMVVKRTHRPINYFVKHVQKRLTY
jgi:hypothetical protein